MSSVDTKVVRASAWVAVSLGSRQFATFAVTIVLARLLAPSAFGLVALASVVLIAASYIQESGLGAATIQRRRDVEAAAGTMLVFASVASALLYGVVFAFAPVFANVFGSPRLTDVLRVLALVVPIRGLASAPGALMERELAFSSRARGELAGAFVQAATAIPLAAAGFGVWSLVAGQVVGELVQTIVFWIVAPYRPSPRLANWRILREMSRYGRHITASNLLDLINTSSDNLVIGRVLGPVGLGTYNLAWRLSTIPATLFGGIVGRAMFAAYSMLQEDATAFREAFVVTLRRVSLVAVPVAVGMVVAAHQIVVGLFGDRWHDAIGPLRIFGIFALINVFSGPTGAVFQAAGRPQLVLMISTWHTAVLWAGLLLLAPRYGIMGAAWAMTIAALSSVIPAYVFALRILDLKLSDLVVRLVRPVGCSLGLVAALLAIGEAGRPLGAGLQLALLIAAGASAYALTVLALNRGDVKIIIAALRSREQAT